MATKETVRLKNVTDETIALGNGYLFLPGDELDVEVTYLDKFNSPGTQERLKGKLKIVTAAEAPAPVAPASVPQIPPEFLADPED